MNKQQFKSWLSQKLNNHQDELIVESAMEEYENEESQKKAVAFAGWKDKEGWKRDYKDQSTHSTLEHYQYWIENVYNK